MSHDSFLSRKTRFLSGLIFVFLTMLLVACGGGSNTQTPSQSKYGGDIKVGLNSDLVTLDPVKSTALVERQVMLNMYDTLTKISPENKVLPNLATSWNYKSPTDLVFTLRTDVKFHDGTPFNADAVVFNIKRILSTPSSPRFSELAAVQDVKAVDASHAEFLLKRPFSPLLATLTDRSGMMLSPTAVQKLGTKLDNGPVGAGSGPFAFVEWVKTDHLSLKRNDHYWQKDAQGNQLPFLKSIRYRPITNGTVMFNNLETGSIDVSDSLDPNSVATAKANPDLVYKQAPGLSFFGIMLNTKAPPLDNVHVRRAIAWGINRQEILSNVFKDIGVLSQGPIPPSSWAYKSDFAPFSYDVNKAKDELSQSGLSNVSFTMLTTSNSPTAAQQAQLIQSQLKAVGITVNIKQETFPTQLVDTQNHDFQAAVQGWSGRPDPDGNIYSWFHTGGGNNNMQYSNTQVDQLLDDARTTDDQAKRTTDYQQAATQFVQDAPYVFIYHGVVIQSSTTKIKNFVLSPTGIMDFSSVTYSAT
ncbi:MAG: ABC transporter substrate-binding protein [Ktedonobacteraceae bacterium]|nr:ABC transporter substrate-binding protein [Ktedonobacteraceae bacterium]